ncbi:MAG: hypothetical protein ABIL00_06010 [candidate division WOR-3 bacterium]
MREEENYLLLKDFAQGLGVSLFGVGDFSRIEKNDFLLREETLKKFPFAISIGLRLSRAILEDLEDHPTKLYFHHYKVVNYLLDASALRIANWIEEKGYWALPIPASQTVDWERQRGHLSHKRVAMAAGLGWLGRNNLLVTPEYGAQVRLATILTDLPLLTNAQPFDFNCGDCFACLSACPVKAIKERPEDFDHQKCFSLLKEFQKKYVPQHICGLCVKACSPKIKKR